MPSSPKVARLGWEEINAELPPKTFLVRRLGLVAGGGAPHAIIAYGYSGKSMLAQSLALSLACGGLVWGAFPAALNKVVYVDLEQGEYLSRERFQRLARGMRADERLLRENLQLVTRRQSISLELGRGFEAEWRDIMTGAQCVVIDSLAAATHGLDENSREIRGPLDLLMALSEETGCRPIIIHHAGKGNPAERDKREIGRGHSSIFDACDCQLILQKGEEGTSGKLVFAKSRSEMRDGGFEYDIVDTQDGDLDIRVSGDIGAGEDGRVSGWSRAIVNALRGAPEGLSKRQLAKVAGVGAKTVDVVFDALRGDIIVTAGVVLGQRAQIFTLSPEAFREAFRRSETETSGVSTLIAPTGTPATNDSDKLH